MRISADSEIFFGTKTAQSEAVCHAVRDLKRDLRKRTMEAKDGTYQRRALGSLSEKDTLCRQEEEQKAAGIWLVETDCEPEGFRICAEAGRLEIGASDPLGYVYGIYAVSRELLGIHNFWFWNDQIVEKEAFIEVPDDYRMESKPYAVRYRGWFINDEVLLHTWKVDQSKDKPWEMAFEALLRCGGNMVIPGTGNNADRYGPLASAMGLYVTHHHAQPLGAKMFVQAYPELNPSYEEHADKFRELWEDGIRRQKDQKVIWGLGFRGQGDYPFWINDSRYQTPESQGKLISRLICQQYDIVRQEIPDAICCTNLYGETMELYQKGYLKIPEDVIKIWADNGFGKMVTRRQENHNPRIPSLAEEYGKGKHGIYYHVSFYDLQAANHITMLPNSPEFVVRELGEIQERNMAEYWLVNCSNVKPHVYFLDLIAEVWRQGNLDIERHREEYVRAYYGGNALPMVSDCFKAYPDYALAYGPNEDDHAGEQFSNHVARILVSQYMKDDGIRAEELLWATDADSLEGQIVWYQKLCRKAVKDYGEYLQKCREADLELGKYKETSQRHTAYGNKDQGWAESRHAQELFEDSLLLQVRLHYECFLGAALVCVSLLEARRGEYQRAFYLAGCARERYLNADQAMRKREHGKWKGFYANECLTDVKQTAWVLEGLMSYLRNKGDGPHYYQWQRDFLYAKEERRVMLIMNMENHLQDHELFGLMKQKWEDQEEEIWNGYLW